MSKSSLDPTSYDYRELACPQCHQAAGSYCKRPSGHSGPFVGPHKERRAAAHAQWRAEEVGLYGKQVTTWDDDVAPVPKPAPALLPPVPVQAPPRVAQLSFF